MNTGVAVEALTVTLGAFRLDKIAFSLSRGTILVILGPNGSGKSVTLETIAGFHRADSGRVLIDGHDVTALPPERRNVGFVVQNFGLFPHLSVEQNITIGRRNNGDIPVPEQAKLPRGDTAALLGYFGVAHLARRMPSALSSGEKQRVALARAVAGAPQLFLFDEPFSALDTQTRAGLRDELLSFLRDLSIPAIFVTHDYSDAMALADAVIVLRDGTAVQSGAPSEIFRKPANPFVARFVGVENVLIGRVTEYSDGIVLVAIGDRVLRVAARCGAPSRERELAVAIRAEDVSIVATGVAASDQAANRLSGRIAEVRPLGALVMVTIDCGFPLKAYLLAPQARTLRLAGGSPVVVEISAEAIHLMRK